MTNTYRPNSLDAFWMPFTPNRHFKANPRLLAKAQGMYYTSTEGRQILDATSGLWCVNAGHGRKEIAEAARAQMDASAPATDIKFCAIDDPTCEACQ